MTLTSTLSRVIYAGNGAAISFPYSFAIPAADALAVVHADALGVETTLVLGTDYSVSGAGEAGGGAVAYPLSGPPLPAGESLTLARRVALTQETDLTNQGPLYAEVHEDAFDKLTTIDQQQQDALDRALAFPVSDPIGLAPALPAAEARAGKALTFDGQGRPRASDLAGQGIAVVSDATPRALGTAAAGTSPDLSRDDHVHPSPASDAAPQALGAASAGTGADLSRADHVHPLTGVQPLDANLTAIAALTPVAGRVIGYDTNGAEAVLQETISNKGYAANRYYSSEFVNTTGTPIALAANTLYAIPFRVRERTIFTRIGVEVTTGAGTNGRLGIYNAANGVPTTLVVDAGNITFSSTGEKEATISQTLMPGLYFLGVVADGTPTLLGGTAQHSAMIQDVGLLSPDAQGSGGTMRISGAHAFGALPANFPAVSRDDTTTWIYPWMRVI